MNSYLYQAHDPDPPAPTASINKTAEQKQKLRNSIQAMLAAHGLTMIKEEILWYDFLKPFRTHTIQSWYRPMLCK